MCIRDSCKAHAVANRIAKVDAFLPADFTHRPKRNDEVVGKKLFIISQGFLGVKYVDLEPLVPEDSGKTVRYEFRIMSRPAALEN